MTRGCRSAFELISRWWLYKLGGLQQCGQLVGTAPLACWCLDWTVDYRRRHGLLALGELCTNADHRDPPLSTQVLKSVPVQCRTWRGRIQWHDVAAFQL